MSAVRLRRLKADYDRLSDYIRRHPRLKLLQVEGDPPERYQLEMQIKSIRMTGGELLPVQSHLVEISLPLSYPRTPPQCRMLSPVFHPNIAPHAICVGDHWGAGESLQSIVARIGEMLAYQSYNAKSPLNGEAARWVEENKDRLPLDRVSLLVEDESPAIPNATEDVIALPSNAATARKVVMPASSDLPPAATPVSIDSVKQAEPFAVVPTPSRPLSPAVSKPTSGAPPSVTEADTVLITCPQCGAEYRVGSGSAGRRVRCRKCLQVFVASDK